MGRVERGLGEPSFDWQLCDLERLGLPVDNDNLPMKGADMEEPQLQTAKGGNGNGGCTRKRQATSTPEAAEAEAQAAAAASDDPAQAAPSEAAPAGRDEAMDEAVPEDGDL